MDYIKTESCSSLTDTGKEREGRARNERKYLKCVVLTKDSLLSHEKTRGRQTASWESGQRALAFMYKRKYHLHSQQQNPCKMLSLLRIQAEANLNHDES